MYLHVHTCNSQSFVRARITLLSWHDWWANTALQDYSVSWFIYLLYKSGSKWKLKWVKDLKWVVEGISSLADQNYYKSSSESVNRVVNYPHMVTFHPYKLLLRTWMYTSLGDAMVCVWGKYICLSRDMPRWARFKDKWLLAMCEQVKVG